MHELVLGKPAKFDYPAVADLHRSPTQAKAGSRWFPVVGLWMSRTLDGAVRLEPIGQQGVSNSCSIDLPADREVLLAVAAQLRQVASTL